MTTQSADGSLDALLDHLKRSRGFDFSGYKRTSLERRIGKRMGEVGVDDYRDYLERLEVDQDEFGELFNTILINVTSFLRDRPAWDYLASDVVPRLLEAVGEHDRIRVWCAGCASGEEAYTTAMVLSEALGHEAYLRRVKIYATEVDDAALARARLGTYPAKDIDAVPPELRERYFERRDGSQSFRKDLRRTIIFGRNDLTQDAPISRIDLLLCRNTLMYFNAEAQSRILNRLHFALNPWGYLFLGKSEMLISHSDLFRPVSLRRRIFGKVPRSASHDHLLALATRAGEGRPEPVVEVRDGAFDASPVAQLVVDEPGALILANAAARSLLGLADCDLGRPLKDLEVSYRPLDLRSNLEVAYAERRTIDVDSVRLGPPAAAARVLDVQIIPLVSGEDTLGAVIAYHDVTAQRHAEKELESSRVQLSHAYEELQSIVEELETTNEELQSTNEELETTNEELQSANEELETMNEELQSTNEELETMNDELGQRSLELNEVNAFLERILGTMELGVIVVDRDQTVQLWNGQSAELWGVRADEAQGRGLWSLDIGLPMDGVRTALRSVLGGAEDRIDLELDVTNRRGRPVGLKLSLLPVAVDGGPPTGALLMLEALAGAAGDGSVPAGD